MLSRACSCLAWTQTNQKEASTWLTGDSATTPTSRSVPLADAEHTGFIFHEGHLCKAIMPGRSTWVARQISSRSIACLISGLTQMSKGQRGLRSRCVAIVVQYTPYETSGENQTKRSWRRVIKWKLLEEVKSSCF